MIAPILGLISPRPLLSTLAYLLSQRTLKRTADYSKELKDYIELIEEKVGVPVGIIAYGPERKQIHFRKDYFS